ncbi:globin domain-containing protein [Thermobifida alba]|uniref:globin domain-containing protein n=1 Tax=Thermobifida alba TaxID=53522 RepID=UPI0020C012A6|nr:globin domain-containing protein [Thermobifida alba]HLU95968.1 globin domain-containing protein [Thermobifida alba]
MAIMATRELPRPDARTVTTVRALCADLLDQPEVLAERFYHHLFRLLPSSRDLFPSDMGSQHVRMARVLVEVVHHLDEPDKTWDNLRRLGGYHYVRWGLGPEEYRCVGHALIEAARDVSLEWAPSVGSAWVTVYEWIASAMLAGAAEAARGPGQPRTGDGAPGGRHAGPHPGEESGKPTVAS